MKKLVGKKIHPQKKGNLSDPLRVRSVDLSSGTKNGSNIAIIHIKCTKNNTIYTLTDLHGNTCGWFSGGSVGFNHSRKTSHPATQKSGKEIINLTRKHGFNRILLKIKGYTRRKKGFIRPLLLKRMNRADVTFGGSSPKGAANAGAGQRQKLFFEKIVNGQSIPFNGCRPPVKRRK
jgi:ribosomal protein S11